MSLQHRNRRQQREQADDYYAERPRPDEALEPQPERHEPRLTEPGPKDLSKRDYAAVLRRAFKAFREDHMTNIAAALAYYAFLAIPSALLVAVGVFSLLAGPDAINTVVDKIGTVAPGQATSLLRQSLTNMTHRQAAGVTVIGIGGLLALWSLSGGA